MASLKLLVVEDDIASLELMTEVFKSLEAEVRPISDSHSAVKIVNQEKFDGIFLDLEMPKLNKMMTLITEINRLLAVKRQRLDTSNPNSLKCPKQCVANLWVG